MALNKRQLNYRLAVKEQRLCRTYCVLVLAAPVLVAWILAAILTSSRGWLGGSPVVALVIVVVAMEWLSWPFRKWRSGRPDYYWGRVPVTYPSEMVDRSGWEPRAFWITFCFLLLPALVLLSALARR